ncbi:MAG TPA: aminoacyl-tRNA deacylase [Candidatus Yaniella excrementigallinarum]|nr:aminoacyl-tRNA deacylase [Candidatus Yaniella excrementigallinarum]
MSTQDSSTPALQAVGEAGLWHRVYNYQHDDAVKGFGAEAADKLDVDPKRIFKTLLVITPQGNLANAILAVADMLSLKRVAKALGVKKVAMAPAALVEKKTGYVLGGVSPLGQKTVLPVIVDTTATEDQTLLVSAGQRGKSLELNVEDLLALTNAKIATIRR